MKKIYAFCDGYDDWDNPIYTEFFETSEDGLCFIKELIENEDKRRPLNDRVIADILDDSGISIARRTVAKYREMLDIPVARLRKQI